MTIKRAEHLTGYEIRRLPAKQGLVTFGAFNNVLNYLGKYPFSTRGEVHYEKV